MEENFELPLTFQLRDSMDIMDVLSESGGPHAMLLSVDAQRPRDYAEQLKVGLAYRFMNTIALRDG